MDPIDIGRWLIGILGYGVAITIVVLVAGSAIYGIRNRPPGHEWKHFIQGAGICMLIAMVAVVATTVLIKIL